MSKGKTTATTRRKRLGVQRETPPRCEGTNPSIAGARCPEDAVTTRKVDGIRFEVCQVHADGIDLMERRRRLAAQ